MSIQKIFIRTGILLLTISLAISCNNINLDPDRKKVPVVEQEKKKEVDPPKKSTKEVTPKKKPMETIRPKPAPERETRPRSASSFSISELQSEFIAAVNEQRAKGCMCGNRKYEPTLPVSWSKTLYSIAADHSRDMAVNQKMSHKGSNGSDVPDRLNNGGYPWMAYAENVAFGHSSIQQVMEGWMSSPGHCKNIMNPNCSEIGVAYDSKYWTMVLAAPRKMLQ